jgi:hypothetical protein
MPAVGQGPAWTGNYLPADYDPDTDIPSHAPEIFAEMTVCCRLRWLFRHSRQIPSATKGLTSQIRIEYLGPVNGPQ